MSPDDPGVTGPPSSKVRLALILSGGASLGSYVAGAVSEIVGALVADPEADIELHVIAGSSAGAVTGALVARAMTVNPGLLPYLEKLWVEALDLRVLLDAARTDRGGILDRAVLDELSRALICGDPASDDRRAPGVAERLRLGLALSNLSGVPTRLRYRFVNAPDRACGVRVHRDAATFELASPTRADDPAWEEVRLAALASAAFPFALPPVPLARRPAAYPEACWPEGEESRRMWFADGSVFANEPIGLAKRLAERSADFRSAAWRYVLVDPDVGEETAVADPSGSLPAVAGALTRAVLGQGAAADWATATETNARLELFEAIVARLPEIADGLCNPDALALGQLVAGLAERVAEAESARRGEAGEDAVLERLDAAVARIENDPRFRDVLAAVDTRAGRTRLAKLIYVLEAASDLRDKQILPLYLVAPRPDEPLAGSFMGNFGGFLERAWRAHDFRAGRRDGARLLQRYFADLVDYRGDPESIETGLASAPSFGAASRVARDSVDRFVDEETKSILASVKAGFPLRATGWLWRPAVRRWVRRWVRQRLEAS